MAFIYHSHFVHVDKRTIAVAKILRWNVVMDGEQEFSNI